tara:strand:+ start:228 stop:425 length:198 start_codon:yes stop_codon:yes gene_type:complete
MKKFQFKLSLKNYFKTNLILLAIKKTAIYNPLLISGYSSVVERLVANEKVVGSSPIARSNTKEYL